MRPEDSLDIIAEMMSKTRKSVLPGFLRAFSNMGMGNRRGRTLGISFGHHAWQLQFLHVVVSAPCHRHIRSEIPQTASQK